jgi:cobalt-zinc-cadmium efflux system protein
VIKNLRKTFSIVLQGVPADVELKTVTDYLNKHNNIKGFQDLHIWSIDGVYHVLTVHLEVSEEKTLLELKRIYAFI